MCDVPRSPPVALAFSLDCSTAQCCGLCNVYSPPMHALDFNIEHLLLTLPGAWHTEPVGISLQCPPLLDEGHCDSNSVIECTWWNMVS